MRDSAFVKLKTLSDDDIFINTSRIVTVEADKKGSCLYLTDGMHVVVSTTMAEIEMLLDVYSKEKAIEELKQENFKIRQQNQCEKIGEYF